MLARSESKARAAVEILRAEAAELGDRLRALVLTDFAEARRDGARRAGRRHWTRGGRRPAGAGRRCCSDEATAALDPVLMTGQRVACGAGRPRARLAAALGCGGDRPPLGQPGRGRQGDGSPAVRAGNRAGTSRWSPRFFAEGGTAASIGTRALLGEGWDAPGVNVVIDLTAATTPTSVVQARGRALRLDAAWPQKVADNWAVVCVTDEHPKGGADYDRFVRKHDRYFALSGAGDIVSGVAHVDPALSPFGPPPLTGADAINAAMLARVGERAAARDRWAIGTPYQDEPMATVTVSTRRSLGLAGRAVLPMAGSAGKGAQRRAWGWSLRVTALGLVVLLALAVNITVGAVLAGLLTVLAAVSVVRHGKRAAAAPAGGCLADMAMATADALQKAGLVSRGAESVRIEPLPDGSYRARQGEVPAREAEVFSDALEDVLSPLAQPRYVVPRLVVEPPDGLRRSRASRPADAHRRGPGCRGLSRGACRPGRQEKPGFGVRGVVARPCQSRRHAVHRFPGGCWDSRGATRRRPVRGDYTDPDSLEIGGSGPGTRRGIVRAGAEPVKPSPSAPSGFGA